ncbi:hypothetical protein F5J12DRAFT_958035 [Pisolithus orientalis]|uniref:uncharacterized protein n=1 Tax=Pisolithus orientalis TaxID=936130 RepID=UPI002224F6B4|nr:uncharacterized protein F5J12DRAFT_958035 [Pisolithus orientalis]KAI5996463.1 hypothetical protein F5J12DRAFT_958035 [Pisolithus orientalis]
MYYKVLITCPRNLRQTYFKLTPSNQGLSSESGYLDIDSVPINDLMPSIAEDVCKAQQCGADDMLEYILRRASKTSDDLIDLNSHVLLDRCINKVLPICNGHTQDIKGFPVSDIRKALIEYTACKQEDDLYQSFVLASNTALVHLKRLKIDGMREEESKEMLDSAAGTEHVLMIGQDKTPTVGKDGNELDKSELQEAPVAERATLVEQAPLRRSARKTTQESTQMASRKRTLGADSESRMSKRPRTEEPGAHVTIQTVLYAAEIQSANIAAKHAFNCIVISDNVWIWYYNHQGLISVAGDSIWRTGIETQPLNCIWKATTLQPHTIKVDGRTLKLDNRERDIRLRLAGRGTRVMDVNCEALKQEKPADMVDGMVEAGKKFEDVRGHVPILLLSKRFLVSTSTIRRALGLKNPEKGSWRLVLLVFKKLLPIKELQGDELVDAWWQSLCPLEGGDPSSVDGKVMGVLNDYDLSSLASSANPSGNEPTGTIPFMAIDLFEKNGQDGRYKDGELLKGGFLCSWAKVDARGCAKEKRYFLAYPKVPDNINNYNLVLRLAIFLWKRLHTRDDFKGDKELAQLDLEDAPSETARQVAEKTIVELDRNLEEQPDKDVFDAFLSKIPSIN